MTEQPEASLPPSHWYSSPLSKASVTHHGRVDQGVDFAGIGPILAIGDGVIIETNGPGWPGGPFMSYRLSAGPAAGKCVYVAENIKVASGIKAGVKVKRGQEIAVMFHGGSGIEMGWARSDGLLPESQTAECGHISGANLPPGGTLIGRNFESLLRALGVGAADNLTQKTGGKIPASWPKW